MINNMFSNTKNYMKYTSIFHVVFIIEIVTIVIVIVTIVIVIITIVISL